MSRCSQLPFWKEIVYIENPHCISPFSKLGNRFYISRHRQGSFQRTTFNRAISLVQITPAILLMEMTSILFFVLHIIPSPFHLSLRYFFLFLITEKNMFSLSLSLAHFFRPTQFKVSFSSFHSWTSNLDTGSDFLARFVHHQQFYPKTSPGFFFYCFWIYLVNKNSQLLSLSNTKTKKKCIFFL